MKITQFMKIKTNKETTFLLDFGPGQLTSFMFILSYEAGFYRPTV